MLTEEDIKVALEFRKRFERDYDGPRKLVWLIDCFRYQTNPEKCDPEGCGKCNHFKRLEERYNGRSTMGFQS